MGERGEGVGRLCGVEGTFGVDEAGERGGMAFVGAGGKGALDDDVAKTGASGGGTGKHGRGGQAEEDLLQEFAVEVLG